MRCGEALALYPADFDLDAEEPTVRADRTYEEGRYRRPKGGKSRVVPIMPALVAEIDELLRERELSTRSTSDHPFSAAKNTSRPLSHGYVLDLVKAAGAAAETRGLHTHMLRHTFGS